MSLHYLLDGYNIINQMTALTRKSLQETRRSFIDLLEQYQPQGSLKNSVTIVFDGKTGMWGSESRAQIQVVFTTDEEADDKIKRIVAHANNKKQVVVVTDDREIKYYVRALGANVLSVKDFISRLKPHKDKGRNTKVLRKPSDDRGKIPKTVEHKITSELEKIWLDKNRDKKR